MHKIFMHSTTRESPPLQKTRRNHRFATQARVASKNDPAEFCCFTTTFPTLSTQEMSRRLTIRHNRPPSIVTCGRDC